MSVGGKQTREVPSYDVLQQVRNHFRPSMEQPLHHGQLHLPLDVSGQSGNSDLDVSGHTRGNASVTVSEEELRNELSLLGFSYIPQQKLLEFKKDLERLMSQGIGTESPGPSGAGNEVRAEFVNTTAPVPVISSPWDQEPTSTSYSSNEWVDQQRNRDPYIKHTVSMGGDKLAARRAPQITRKVLRRKSDGQTHISDESFIYSETDTEEVETGSSIEEFSARSSVSSSADCAKSFIRPPPYSLLDQYRQRSDPVGRYHEYKHKWDSLQVALERNRKELRWGIREQMMSAPPQPAARSMPLPNNYVIPTDKKRHALRWAIRRDLVNGVIPRGNCS